MKKKIKTKHGAVIEMLPFHGDVVTVKRRKQLAVGRIEIHRATDKQRQFFEDSNPSTFFRGSVRFKKKPRRFANCATAAGMTNVSLITTDVLNVLAVRVAAMISTP